MVNLITGNNGKGKSKILIDKVNEEIKEILGNVVFLDTSTKHMYDLNNRIRLINASDYYIDSSDMFVGFLYGILSQDHDLQQIYCDNFLKISNTDINSLEAVFKKLDQLSDQFGIDLFLAVSTSDGPIPDVLAQYVIEAL